MIIQKLQNPNFWIDYILNDLYFFCRCILRTLEDPTPGYKDLHRPLHKRLCNFVQKYAQPGNKLLILLPRGWIKSYIITVGWTIQRMLKNLILGQREHWIINNATLPNAKEFLEKIKYNLQFNEIIRELFNQYLPQNPDVDAERWTLDEIQILGNKVETGSVEGNLVSRHYKGIINDDLVNKENSYTREQIEKVIDWWKLAQSLLTHDGIEFLIGTRWDLDDLYGYVIERFLEIPKEELEKSRQTPIFEWHHEYFHLFEAGCWEDPINERGSTFPTLYPERRLKEIQKQQADRFGGQYLNDPLAMTNKPFQLIWLKNWRTGDVPAVVNTLMTIDPCGKEKAESDYTGMTIADAGCDEKVYFKFAQRKLITDLKLAEWIIEIACQYQPGIIGIEENKFNVITELLRLIIPMKIRRGEIPQHLAEFAMMIPNICTELKHRNRNKELRVKNLTGWFESGRMLLAPKDMDDFKDELLRFPSAKRDDIADAAAYILDILVFPKPDEPEKIFAVPEDLKMTAVEREKKEWESYRDTVQADERRGFVDYEGLY